MVENIISKKLTATYTVNMTSNLNHPGQITGRGLS